MNDKILLLVGASGSGKSTVAVTLGLRHGWKQIPSYTTRPQRYEGESGHVFVNEEDFIRLEDLVAYSEYGGYRYGATARQVDENEIYVVDPPGVISLVEKYKGSKAVYLCILHIPPEVCYERMRRRGDHMDEAALRIMRDSEWFSDDILYGFDDMFPSKQVLHVFTDDLSTTVHCIEEWLEEEEE